MEHVTDIDWEHWQPKDRATLLFVVRDGQILLIRKKRGLGAGKINGPGGRLEPGESLLECAIRETEEELVTTPSTPSISGQLQFQFADGYSIHVHVFRADDCDREPQETEEAIPIWAAVDRLPFDEMWEDDRIWLPMLLRRELFHGRFLFDDDRMVDHEMLPYASGSNGPSLSNDQGLPTTPTPLTTPGRKEQP